MIRFSLHTSEEATSRTESLGSFLFSFLLLHLSFLHWRHHSRVLRFKKPSTGCLRRTRYIGLGPYSFIFKGQFNYQYLKTSTLISGLINNQSKPSINLIGSIISQNSIPTKKTIISPPIFYNFHFQKGFFSDLTLTLYNLLLFKVQKYTFLLQILL